MIGKIKFWMQIFLVFTINCFWIGVHSYAQSNVANKYGLFVINNMKDFRQTISVDSNKQMLSLRKYLPNVSLDLRYATTHNFMHQKLYPAIRTTYLRRAAIEGLKKVVEYLKTQNLNIKVFDAYRPYSVTEKMWEIIQDERYVADPSKGSGHNRGVAVDLTLIKSNTTLELPMGTGFDNFTDTAHTGFIALSADILRNRNILKSTMEKFGFISFDTEWWHFSLPHLSSFELLDLTFNELNKLNSHPNLFSRRGALTTEKHL